jgi:hypothetical protein
MVSVVELVHQVAGGHLRHAAAHRAVIQHRHAASGARQQVGGGQAGDTRADDADVDVHVLLKGSELRQRGGGRPDGLVAGHSNHA